jgi:adenylylsulfate reductase subunit A
MDEYVGGISTGYMTNDVLLNRGLELLGMLREDMNHIGAEDLLQLQRAWELKHRLVASESVTHHTLFREETRWPGYYYRGDHMKLDDNDWHCFTLSQYDRQTGEWQMENGRVANGESARLSYRRLRTTIASRPDQRYAHTGARVRSPRRSAAG